MYVTGESAVKASTSTAIAMTTSTTTDRMCFCIGVGDDGLPTTIMVAYFISVAPDDDDKDE